MIVPLNSPMKVHQPWEIIKSNYHHLYLLAFTAFVWSRSGVGAPPASCPCARVSWVCPGVGVRSSRSIRSCGKLMQKLLQWDQSSCHILPLKNEKSIEFIWIHHTFNNLTIPHTCYDLFFNLFYSNVLFPLGILGPGLEPASSLSDCLARMLRPMAVKMARLMAEWWRVGFCQGNFQSETWIGGDEVWKQKNIEKSIIWICFNGSNSNEVLGICLEIESEIWNFAFETGQLRWLDSELKWVLKSVVYN